MKIITKYGKEYQEPVKTIGGILNKKDFIMQSGDSLVLDCGRQVRLQYLYNYSIDLSLYVGNKLVHGVAVLIDDKYNAIHSMYWKDWNGDTYLKTNNKKIENYIKKSLDL